MASLRQPILFRLEEFDATKPITFKFAAGSRNEQSKISGNELVIEDKDSKKEIYRKKETGGLSANSHQVPQGTMKNGTNYSANVYLFDEAGNKSPSSNTVYFKCYTQPTIRFTSIPDNKIIDKTYHVFTFIYKQDEAEPLVKYIINLYNENREVIDSSGEEYPEYKPSTTYGRGQLFGGFDNNTSYYIELKAETESGIKLDTGLIRFDVRYEVVQFPQICWAENNCKKGSIEVRCNAGIINPTVSPRNPTYVGGKELDLRTDAIVTWDERFTTNGDFVMRVWFKSPVTSVTKPIHLVKLEGKNSSGDITSEITAIAYISRNTLQIRFNIDFMPTGGYSVETEKLPYAEADLYCVQLKRVGKTYEASLLAADGSTVPTSKSVEVSLAESDVEFDTLTVTGGVFDDVEISDNVANYGNVIIPQDWDGYTAFNATFNNTLFAGNLPLSIGEIKELTIKRKIKGSGWITMKTVAVSDYGDLRFQFQDYATRYGEEYEYAIIPVLQNDNYAYYSTDKVVTKFSGVFVCDAENSYKLFYGVNYPNTAANQQTGIFTPLGKKYPTVISNGYLEYDSGSTSFVAIDSSYEDTRMVDRLKATRFKNEIKKFLLSKKPKIIKDWNGNIWLATVVDNVQVAYTQGSGMGVPQMTFNWIEIGDSDNEKDLVDAGFAQGRIGGE